MHCYEKQIGKQCKAPPVSTVKAGTDSEVLQTVALFRDGSSNTDVSCAQEETQRAQEHTHRGSIRSTAVAGL